MNKNLILLITMIFSVTNVSFGSWKDSGDDDQPKIIIATKKSEKNDFDWADDSFDEKNTISKKSNIHYDNKAEKEIKSKGKRPNKAANRWKKKFNETNEKIQEMSKMCKTIHQKLNDIENNILSIPEINFDLIKLKQDDFFGCHIKRSSSPKMLSIKYQRNLPNYKNINENLTTIDKFLEKKRVS